MSSNGVKLYVGTGSQLERDLHAYIDLWPSWKAMNVSRSAWLGAVEERLRIAHPDASSADLRLTARSLAPFPLAEGHDVP